VLFVCSNTGQELIDRSADAEEQLQGEEGRHSFLQHLSLNNSNKSLIISIVRHNK
jgi:hypothetical protein